MFTLLHTNDLHNHLHVAQAGLLRRARAAIHDTGLLLDAGDAVASGNITFHHDGEAILDTMSDIGYDAMTVGNREFHFLRRGFDCKLRRARFPVLCANVRSRSGLAPPTHAVLVRDLTTANETLRVAIVGLTVPMITAQMMVRYASAYVFDDPIQTAVKLVPKLRSDLQPDIIIALTHIGIKQDRELAERVPDIDLIIGGHSHDALQHGERVGETFIVQTGSHAHYIGSVNISIERAGNCGPADGKTGTLTMSNVLLPLPERPSEDQIQSLLRSLGDQKNIAG